MLNFAPLRIIAIVIATLITLGVSLPKAAAQRCGTGTTSGKCGGTSSGTIPTPGRSTAPPLTIPNQTNDVRPIMISGNVVLKDGAPLPEPVMIERVCNGSSRREGYTDSKGAFQIQLGQNTGVQDATESDLGEFGSQRSGSNSGSPGGLTRTGLLGCEIRARLAGFRSSSVLLNPEENLGMLQVGTVVLERMGNVEGTTISMTSMQAPKDARNAYEKAQKALSKDKLGDAEKDLKKAVQVYPQFAAAWSLLGMVHERQQQSDQAILDYNRSLSADSRYVNPYFGLASVALREKRWKDVVRFTDEVARLNPFAYPESYLYSAAANYNLGNLEPAERNTRKFQLLDTEHRHPEAALLLSEILASRHDYAGAAEQKKNYLSIAPNAANADAVKAEVKRLEALSPVKAN